MLDPFSGPDEGFEPLTGEDLRREVAFYKQVADRNGTAYDPEWDRWLAEDAASVPGART